MRSLTISGWLFILGMAVGATTLEAQVCWDCEFGGIPDCESIIETGAFFGFNECDESHGPDGDSCKLEGGVCTRFAASTDDIAPDGSYRLPQGFLAALAVVHARGDGGFPALQERAGQVVLPCNGFVVLRHYDVAHLRTIRRLTSSFSL